jgi:hypothetical protein
MKIKFVKHPSIFLATLLEPCNEIWQFFLNFGLILAIENCTKNMILVLSNKLISHLVIYIQVNGGGAAGYQHMYPLSGSCQFQCKFQLIVKKKMKRNWFETRVTKTIPTLLCKVPHLAIISECYKYPIITMVLRRRERWKKESWHKHNSKASF